MRTTRLRVSLTNVSGQGATILVKSLLPALEAAKSLCVEVLYLPPIGDLADYRSTRQARTVIYRRGLPKAVSRLFECTLFSYRFEGLGPLLVLGDLPLRIKGRQAVFVHNPHLVDRSDTNSLIDGLRFAVSRALFRLNLDRVSRFIVQSDFMRERLVATYPECAGRVDVIGQPPPDWLLDSGLKRSALVKRAGSGLRLFYPAAAYPHKNHSLLAAAAGDAGWTKLVDRMALTIDVLPGRPSWAACIGKLSAEDVVAQYRECDALVFLSKAESLGFPLVEAMWIGLPIVCPDRAYAHSLCGDEAIYFDPDDIGSLKAALVTLRQRLDDGWWPDWSERLARLPQDWDAVADRLAKILSDEPVAIPANA